MTPLYKGDSVIIITSSTQNGYRDVVVKEIDRVNQSTIFVGALSFDAKTRLSRVRGTNNRNVTLYEYNEIFLSQQLVLMNEEIKKVLIKPKIKLLIDRHGLKIVKEAFSEFS